MALRTSILAEGDSWFAYPSEAILFGRGTSNVLDTLWRKHKSSLMILNKAKNGDEARFMFNSDGIADLVTTQKEMPFKVWLLSAGGNDIVGDADMPQYLLPRAGAASGVACLDTARFQQGLDAIIARYRDLLEAVKTLPRRKIPLIIAHTYDYPFPDPKGAIFLSGLVKINGGKSWIYPHMANKGIVEEIDQQAIIRRMLELFRDALNTLAAGYPGLFFVAQTQGLLTNRHAHWVNEIHPSDQGCDIIADVLWETIQRALGR